MTRLMLLMPALCILLALYAPARAQSTFVPEGTAYAVIAEHYNLTTGAPRVEQISDHVWAAIGYDLANVILIRTDAGSVIVDTAMSPGRAREIKAALSQQVDVAPVAAIIYTHSHIDHIGGATEWAGPDTPIWSTDALPPHLLKQYGLFMPIEQIRGGRQFGRHVPPEINAYSALGKQVDIQSALENGVLLPTDTFSEKHTLTIGGLELQLYKAPGETHDQLFIYVPADETIISGDNFYWSFPNLYTLRGASPRPVDEWIASLDAMRALDPEHLAPCHNKPLHGKQEIRAALTDYRDAIQWVRDATVRGANQGLSMDELAESIALPEHLAQQEFNKQFYGQVDWSVRAIYTNNLGWFDGRAETLYTLPAGDTAAREVELMGGADAVLALADKALQDNDLRWAAHLLAKLRKSNPDDAVQARATEKLAAAYERLAETTFNTNGRAYLLETAHELRNGLAAPDTPEINPRLAESISLDHIFAIMASKLDPERAMDVHESVLFKFTDLDEQYVVTVRRGVAEVVRGEPLPGTPKPVAALTTDSVTYKRLALGLEQPAAMFASGKIKIKGGMPALLAFLKRFDTGM